ncbi:hypothetical protein FNH08_07315 [Streptomyces spongiae]|uniref:Twin-arginine translocation signal domain-containing protein n=1 Tax=Streptomyces spongiae TaxID=565072 RepID=A0A5N8XCZ3_9ACTN|nr:hypothetical protein [Streptomyces spongiae]
MSSRRQFVSRVVAGTAASVAVGTVGYGTHDVLRGPKAKRLSIPSQPAAKLSVPRTFSRPVCRGSRCRVSR